MKSILVISLLMLSSFWTVGNCQDFYFVPTQELSCKGLLSSDFNKFSLSIDSFQLSPFITYGEYKEYLNHVKSDSSEKFYHSQLPDSNMCLPPCYMAYASVNDYDDYPVVGIRWEAAMNYCRWRTLQEQPLGELKYYYRLPTFREWIAAYASLNETSDLNKEYADWLLNTKDESVFLDNKEGLFDYIYMHKPSDPPVLKRKLVVGNSFLYQHAYLDHFYYHGYYAFDGYRHVSFRIVKEWRKSPEGPQSLYDHIAEDWK